MTTNAHDATCPTCGYDAAALLAEIERLRLRLRTFERYGVDPMPATGTNSSTIRMSEDEYISLVRAAGWLP